MSFKTLDEYKVGWWKKGSQYRYCYGIFWGGGGLTPFVKYKTRSGYEKNSRISTALNAVCDNWFPNAEYIGLDLNEKKTD